ncbi:MULTISPECIES: glycosyltransferase family 32 protein [Methylobacterium]|uniref:glycosyltransferase family 32 protein n=1 Tax=Methylobacterium TaxID=407 RepID=UPI0013EA5E37|nr:glycosyltransferase [Methylobacterium sp. DB0501]NGM38126.1 hypothetical protein [Methylobacterium sp. DB0501]
MPSINWEKYFTEAELDLLAKHSAGTAKSKEIFWNPELSFKFVRACIDSDISFTASSTDLLDSVQGNFTTNHIPKKIVQFWAQKDIPADVHLCMNSWIGTCNGEYELFNDESARDFIAKFCSKEQLEAYDYSHHPAMRSDVFRLLYLFHNGGYYIDADDERREFDINKIEKQHKSFNLILSPLAHHLSSNKMINPIKASTDSEIARECKLYYNNSPIFAIKNHPIIGKAIEYAVENIFLCKKSGLLANIHYHTGPNNLTYSTFEYCARNFLSTPSEGHIGIIKDWDALATAKCLSYQADDRNWRSNAEIYNVRAT